jgi:CheY-like chemotaxis protein
MRAAALVEWAVVVPASVVTADRENCLAAGYDALVSEPIDQVLDLLATELRQGRAG